MNHAYMIDRVVFSFYATGICNAGSIIVKFYHLTHHSFIFLVVLTSINDNDKYAAH